MSELKDPARWIEGGDDAPEGFAGLVRDDAAGGPGAAQLAQLLDGVALKAGRPELSQAYRAQGSAETGAAAGGSSAANAGVGAGLSAGVKLAITAAVVGLSAAAWWSFVGSAHEAEASRARVKPAAAVAPAQAPQARALPETPASGVPEGETARGVDPPQLTGGAGARAARPARTREAAAPIDPAAELALLEQAQLALRKDPARALTLAERHRTRFAGGQFEQEREMLAIEALLKLARKPAAARRAAAFEQRYPHSGHLPRLRDLLQAER